MHLLTNVYVHTVLCCKCWYCWFFFLTFTGSRPFWPRTPSSPVENCMYLFTFHLWYSIKCLMHILTNVYVNTVICCKCWYCWFFFLTFTGSRPFWRGTPSSPVENCMYLLTYHLWYSIKCLMHLLTTVYVNIEICCKCWYCWFFFLTFTGSSSDTADSFSWLLQVPGHFDEGRHHLQLKTVCIYLPTIYDIPLNALCIY